jgi:hypothetical protein
MAMRIQSVKKLLHFDTNMFDDLEQRHDGLDELEIQFLLDATK